MNSLLDDDYDEPSGKDREVTLSTATILGIFLGLVLLCGLFFGFGYKVGSSRTAPLAALPVSPNPKPTSTSFNNFKPAAGSPIESPASPAHPTPAPQTRSAAETAEDSASPPAAHSSTPIVHAASEAASAAPGTILVQVAAFTHQEDADFLVHALKGQGYSAVVRSEPQDKLLHIQMGPYNNRKDAETMKQRLLADGYQPIVK